MNTQNNRDSRAELRGQFQPFELLRHVRVATEQHCTVETSWVPQTPEHHGADLILVIALECNVNWRRDDDHVVRCEPGNFLWIVGPARVGQIWRAGGKGAFVVVTMQLHAHVGRRVLQAFAPSMFVAKDEPWAQLLEGMRQLIVQEIDADRPGLVALLVTATDVLLTQTLRAQLLGAQSSRGARSGWLAAVADPELSRAVAAFHRDIAKEWTVAALARCAGLSRTLFHERFVGVVGSSPIEYVRQWRMCVAADFMQGSGLSLDTVAERVGYRSTTAFARAFKHAHGVSPAQMRGRQ